MCGGGDGTDLRVHRGEDGLAALAMILATYQSSKEGRSVNPQDLWKELL